MYKCFNGKKVIRLIVIDIAVIAAISGFVKFSGIDWSALNCCGTESGIFLPVIMYHSIVDDPSMVNDYVITPQEIENDLKYLSENGYETILTKDLTEYIENDIPLPQKPVMITLDDGFYNNEFYLLPLLEKYDMQAIISVVGEFSEEASHHDAHVPKYSYLTWQDISDISKSPHIEIGNHTYSMHNNNSRKGCSKLSYETEEEYSAVLSADIEKLQNMLTDYSGTAPVSFAYPYGSISRESIPILKKAGFAVTFTCYERPNYITKNTNCLYGLNRYNRSGKMTTEEFMKKLLKE